MLFQHWTPQTRRAMVVAIVAVVASGFAQAQSTPTRSDFSSSVVSSSDSSSSQTQMVADYGADGSGALPSAPAAAFAGAGQDDTKSSGGFFHHLTFEGGGGVNAPASSASKDYITWGGQFGLGGGYKFSDRLSVMLDFQFIDDKLPGKLIAETGASGGNAHIWSLTANPEFDMFPKSTNDVYLVGGGGFYRKVTNFTDPAMTQYCDYFYCYPGYTNQVVGHFSSNQGGFSLGGGYQRRIGGLYGDSNMKIFAEVRYLDVLSPASAIAPNGLGTATVGAGTKLIPITFGVRW